MIIDLTPEEWEFLQRMCTRAVALAEMMDESYTKLPSPDVRKAKKLMEKFIKERK